MIDIKDIDITRFKKGTPVNYHSIIGGEITMTTKIREEPWALPSGETVCMIQGKAGAVSLRALSLVKGELENA